jgi:hypothetical protein
MYAAMSARQESTADVADDEPTNVAKPIRRLVAVGIAAGLIVASGTHVTSISAWVADHVQIPGVGDTGKQHPKGDQTPGRSANLHTPTSGDDNGAGSTGGTKNTPKNTSTNGGGAD